MKDINAVSDQPSAPHPSTALTPTSSPANAGSPCAFQFACKAWARLLGPGSRPGRPGMLGEPPGSIATPHPTPIVVLGLDPGTRCVGKPVKGLRSRETRGGATSALHNSSVADPRVKPEDDAGEDEMLESKPLPSLAAPAKAGVHEPLFTHRRVGKAAGSRIMSKIAMGLGPPSRLHHHHSPHPHRHPRA
ncbi:hypothetical protein SAMN05428936_101566 [Pelagibacterium halotolerans]|nr:hypothetical protein SAMN05428936_101566 [Pelagibacterium halotolerans]